MLYINNIDKLFNYKLNAYESGYAFCESIASEPDKYEFEFKFVQNNSKRFVDKHIGIELFTNSNNSKGYPTYIIRSKGVLPVHHHLTETQICDIEKVVKLMGYIIFGKTEFEFENQR